jgi:hypothetical protein
MLERVHVRQILRATGGTLVPDQSIPSDHGYLAPLQLEHTVCIDGLLEREAIDGGQDVDAKRRQPDLNTSSLGREIPGIYLEVGERHAKLGQRAVHARCIVRLRPDQDVHVLGRTRMAVKGDGMPSDQQEFGAGIVKRDEHVAEIWGKRRHSSLLGMRRIGMVARVYCGKGLPESAQAVSVSS